MPATVNVADRLAARLDYGFRNDLVSLEVDDDVLDELELTRKQLDGIRKAMPQAYAEVESTFGVRVSLACRAPVQHAPWQSRVPSMAIPSGASAQLG